MTRATQSRAVASGRQDELLAIAQAGDCLGTEELIRWARVPAPSPDRTGDDRQLFADGRAKAEARRVEQLEDHIRRVVDTAPPLTAQQRDKLAVLLRQAASDRPTHRHKGRPRHVDRNNRPSGPDHAADEFSRLL